MLPLASTWMVLAALDGLMAVAAGAFGAHGVSDPHAKDLLRTGAQYQLAHAAAALALCALPVGPRALAVSGWAFSVGGLIFGGALYLLAASGPRVLGAVAPVGGLLMMLGWGTVAVGLVLRRI